MACSPTLRALALPAMADVTCTRPVRSRVCVASHAPALLTPILQTPFGGTVSTIGMFVAKKARAPDKTPMTRSPIRPLLVLATLAWSGLAGAQDAATQREAEINVVKMDIARGENILRKFAGGLPFCKILDGTSVYLENQKRVLALTELEESLRNLVKDKVVNARKNAPWTEAEAEDRMKVAKRLAEQEKDWCDDVAKLPELKRRLTDLAPKETQDTKETREPKE
jgi:hypothetical protein